MVLVKIQKCYRSRTGRRWCWSGYENVRGLELEEDDVDQDMRIGLELEDDDVC